MGQYYRPCVLKKNWKTAKQPVAATLLCYDFDNGAKLMEHSWIGNGLVRRIEYLLANDFNGYPFVWCGDYADTIETHAGIHDFYTDANYFIYKDYDGDSDDTTAKYYALKGTIPQLWDGEGKYNPYQYIPYYKYLVNYTKKEYCIMPKHTQKKYQVNPLPLLTCSGNGLGGGDFTLVKRSYNYKTDNRIGSWAFDRIGLSNDKNDIKGFKKIKSYFPSDI